MCDSTFRAVRDLGRELGAVTQEGPNDQGLVGWDFWRSREQRSDEDAVLLAMGRFIYWAKGGVDGPPPPVVLTAKDLNPETAPDTKHRLFGRGSNAVMPSFISLV